LEGNKAKVSGPKGELSFVIPAGIKIAVADGQIVVSQERKTTPRQMLYRINPFDS